MVAADAFFRSGIRDRATGILVVLALHVLLLLLVSARPVMRDSIATGPRTDIVFIQSPRIVAEPPKPVAPLIPLPRSIPKMPARNKPARNEPSTYEPRIAVENSAPAEPILETPDVFAEDGQGGNGRKIDPAELIRLAGKLDRDNRVPGENLLNTPEGKSLRQKMDDAFTNARLAVPPKWYEAARIELWSAPNDPAKIYQVKTAFGTFCLFYPDKNKMGQDSGGAKFGQPKMSTCPKRF